MGILLGLGNAQLGLAVVGKILAQNVFELHGGIGNLTVWHGGIVFRHADIVNLLAAAATLKALEVIVAEDAGHLAGTVRKFMKMTVSPSSTRPPSQVTTGTTNSSVTSAA